MGSNSNDTIILIGPTCSGKTTLGEMVSKELCKKHVSLDIIAKKYYKDFGFTKNIFSSIEKSKGYLEAYKAWEPARIYAVEKVITDYPKTVIDFGAGHSHFIDKNQTQKMELLFFDFQNVFLILPTYEHKTSIAILRERNLRFRNKSWIYDGYDFIEHWVTDYDNYLLAKKIIYSEGKSFTQIKDDIVHNIVV